MPLYDYKCKECEHQYSAMRSIAQRNDSQCPSCESEDVILVISGAAIISGTGDFKNKAPDGFKDMLKTIKKNSGSKSTIDI